ncbi:hypothetical protein, partial [Arthrobacter ginsengisoli]|uniref:hypothetical protein n=1 Tax=Arthrobacter ginsengisoli TaxID=1356565 RepID=UPI00286A3AEC
GVAQSSQFNQSITINWYQQTWHTIEFSNNRHIRSTHKNNSKQLNSFVSAFLRCDISSLFHPYPLCKSGFSSKFHSVEQMNPAKK